MQQYIINRIAQPAHRSGSLQAADSIPCVHRWQLLTAAAAADGCVACLV
jgi:hypothetical protein